MRRAALLALVLLVAAPSAPAAAKSFHLKLPQFARPGDRVDMAAPTPRPRIEPAAPPAAPDPVIDLSHALPGKALAKLPSSAQQLKSLASELKQGQPRLSSAKQKSDSLAAEAASLRQQMIDTAARIETLEQSQVEDAAAIDRLEAEDARLSAGFANDRVAVTRLLAILERLQHDMPPALVLRPDDALGAARGAMLVGATLPPVYAQAASLSRRIDALGRTRAALERRRTEANSTALHLAQARQDLDKLLARKEQEAAGAAQTYGTLKQRMDAVARQAADFQALLTRVKAMRQKADGQTDASVVTVTAENNEALGGLAKGSLLEPVVGTPIPGNTETPGLSYATRANAQVIAPADGKVLYAGPYHKAGQVLILEITTGYDLVLAGLGRVTVKPNDELLAGEPVGTMSSGEGPDNRLYFEVRHGGHGENPTPWLKLKLRPVL